MFPRNSFGGLVAAAVVVIPFTFRLDNFFLSLDAVSAPHNRNGAKLHASPFCVLDDADQ